MTTTFPTSLQDLDATRGTGSDKLSTPNHVTHHTTEDDTIEALQAKVGIDGSAVTTSHDYKLSEVTSTDKAVGKSATQTLTNKTLTSPIVNLGSDAEGDTYYRNSSGALTRLPKGTDNYIYKMNGNVPNWEAETTISAATEAAEGISRLATAAQITAGTATESGYPLVITPDQLAASTPVFNGSGLTNLTNPAVYKSGNTSYNLTTASGTQTIAHGLGKTPKYVRISFILSQTNIAGTSGIANLRNGVGTFNGTTYATWYTGTQSGDTSGNYTTIQTTSYLVAYEAGSGGSDVSQKATAALDSTNITLTWTKTASPTGTLLMTWEAFA